MDQAEMERQMAMNFKRMSMDAAEEIAVQALGFLAGDAEHLSRFLAITGLEPANLREAAKTPEFLAGVLSFIGEDESLIRAFAANAGLAPDAVGKACETLAARWERDSA